jgi:hypothetical protein
VLQNVTRLVLSSDSPVPLAAAASKRRAHVEQEGQRITHASLDNCPERSAAGKRPDLYNSLFFNINYYSPVALQRLPIDAAI